VYIDVHLTHRGLRRLRGGDDDGPEQSVVLRAVFTLRQTRTHGAGSGKIEGQRELNLLAVERAAERREDAGVDEAIVFAGWIDGHDKAALALEYGVAEELNGLRLEGGQISSEHNTRTRVERRRQRQNRTLIRRNGRPEVSIRRRSRIGQKRGSRMAILIFGRGARFFGGSGPGEDKPERAGGGGEFREHFSRAHAQIRGWNGTGDADNDVRRGDLLRTLPRFLRDFRFRHSLLFLCHNGSDNMPCSGMRIHAGRLFSSYTSS
jgi:hypothetical protein